MHACTSWMLISIDYFMWFDKVKLQHSFQLDIVEVVDNRVFHLEPVESPKG